MCIHSGSEFDCYTCCVKPQEDNSGETWKKKPCLNPGHEVPGLLYIPPGQTYKHVCPGCNNEIVVTTPEITW